MLNADQSERYLRHILLKEVGAQGQQKLLGAKVLVVGAGGLGAPIIQYLAGAGVGVLGIADDDHVSLSNLQRQVIFTTADVGAPKAEAAAAYARALNPDIKVIPHEVKVDAEMGGGLIAGYDIVVEGIDSFEGRFALNHLCITARRPLVSAAIGQFGGQVCVFKPYAGADLPCYRCLTPAAPPREHQLNCAEEGVLGPLAGIVGSVAALEAIKEILGIGETLAGRLWLYDGLAAHSRTIALPRDPKCVDCAGVERK